MTFWLRTSIRRSKCGKVSVRCTGPRRVRRPDYQTATASAFDLIRVHVMNNRETTVCRRQEVSDTCANDSIEHRDLEKIADLWHPAAKVHQHRQFMHCLSDQLHMD